MSEPTVIPPTPGRVVWYFPSLGDKFPLPSDGQPLAATVARVWNDRMVNLTVHDADGNVHARTSVQLVQPGEPVPSTAYCCWMPFQREQAAKQQAG